MSDWINVTPANDFPPGTYRAIDVDGTLVAIFNLNGQYYAIEDRCTHDDEVLTGGPVQGDEVVCPRHGARFCIRNGKALSAPAYEDVPVFPVRVQDGVVQVRDDRWD